MTTLYHTLFVDRMYSLEHNNMTAAPVIKGNTSGFLPTGASLSISKWQLREIGVLGGNPPNLATLILEFHTLVCYCGDISTSWNVTLNKTNCDWLFDMSVKRPHGRALANEHGHLFQTFSHQSEGLATQD